MQTQRNELNFEGQNIFVGIDMHLKSWNISIFSASLHHKTFNQPANPEVLSEYLQKNYPNASYYSVYEAGFCGLWAHYKLNALGVANIVVNPADVPTTQKEKVTKRDAIDSNKQGRALRTGELKGIHIPQFKTMEDRTLIRTRSAIVKDKSRIKQRIKSLLYYYGIEYPAEFERVQTHWTNRFILWLKSIELTTSSGKQALNLLIIQAEQQRALLLDATRKIRELSRTETYAQNMNLIMSIPGIGLITGMMLLTEIEDINRFVNSDHLASYIGFVPSCHTSGDVEDNNGEMTSRGHYYMRYSLIECSWVAVRKDPALSQAYYKYCQRMNSNKAITRIGRKLINRIYAVLKHQKTYENGILG